MYISVAEASKKWGISPRQVQRLLALGWIPRAQKLGRSWMIPDDAEKPFDMRRKNKAPQESLCPKAPSLSALLRNTFGPPELTLSSDLSRVIEASKSFLPRDNPSHSKIVFKMFFAVLLPSFDCYSVIALIPHDGQIKNGGIGNGKSSKETKRVCFVGGVVVRRRRGMGR